MSSSFQFNFGLEKKSSVSDVSNTASSGANLQADGISNDTPIQHHVNVVPVPHDMYGLAQKHARIGSDGCGASISKRHELVIGKGIVMRKRLFLGWGTSLANVASSTDVKSGIYEGGFKDWECGRDLVLYLSKSVDTSARVPVGAVVDDSESKNAHVSPLRGMRVLEIGCGHGWPGVFCLQRGAASVVFQDLNVEVLKECTMFNVALNDDNAVERAAFVAGDWRDPSLHTALLRQQAHRKMASTIADNRFGLILSADTLYDPRQYDALWSLTNAMLRPGGTALFAAKRYYFGVGGSVALFRDVVCKSAAGSSAPRVSFVGVIDDGRSNVREIVKIDKPRV